MPLATSNVKQYVRTQEWVIWHSTAEKDKDIEKFHIDPFSLDIVTQSTTELKALVSLPAKALTVHEKCPNKGLGREIFEKFIHSQW